MADTSEVSLSEFNALPDPAAQHLLRRCLDVPRWAREVAAGRPYPGRAALREHAGRAAAELSEDELDGALAGHPRIGERAGAGHDTALSTREQSGVDRSDTGTATRLRAGNLAYEKRFDRVFLIRAAGRDAGQILTELERRLGNDDAAERAEVVTQLREIALLRLEQVVRS